MADGVLSRAAPAAATEVNIYTVPADTLTTADIHIANRGTGPSLVRIAIGPNGSGSVADADYIAYDLSVSGGEAVQFSRQPMSAGEIVTVYSDTGLVSFRIAGVEEVA